MPTTRTSTANTPASAATPAAQPTAKLIPFALPPREVNSRRIDAIAMGLTATPAA